MFTSLDKEDLLALDACCLVSLGGCLVRRKCQKHHLCSSCIHGVDLLLQGISQGVEQKVNRLPVVVAMLD